MFFFNDTATTEIYTLSLHDALPISEEGARVEKLRDLGRAAPRRRADQAEGDDGRVAVLLYPHVLGGEGGRRVAVFRSEEHTSELQSRQYLVCRLLPEKKTSQSYYLS